MEELQVHNHLYSHCMIIRFLIITLLFLASGCKVQTMLLENGITTVPISKELSKTRFSAVELDSLQIDTSVIYESLDPFTNALDRLEIDDSYNSYSCFRFYENGCINYFVLSKDEDDFVPEQFDPNYNGYRGIYYLQNGKVKYELYGIKGEGLKFGKMSGEFSFDGDNLFQHRNIHTAYSTRKFIKREIPLEFLDFEADW